MMYLPSIVLIVSILVCQTLALSGDGPSSELSNASFDEKMPDTIVRGGWVFETAQAVFVRNRGIVVRDGRFEALEVAQDTNARVTIELLDSQYVLPGLIDCHAHYNVKLIERRREEFSAMPVLYLANGVTVTFSCGEFDPVEMQALRLRIESGEQIGPRLVNSGPYFGRARPGWRGEKEEAEIRSEVDYWVKAGVGGFKAKQINRVCLQTLIEQAHKHGLTVTGHLDSGFRDSVNPRDAVDMGIDRIEHFLGGDAMVNTKPAYDSLGSITADMPEYKRAVQHFIDHGTWFDATLTAYGYNGSDLDGYDHWIDERQFFTPYMRGMIENRKPVKVNQQFDQIYRAKLETIGAYYQAGGRITMGTDHVSDGNYLPGFSSHRELDAFVRCGIPVSDAIRIGTIYGAKALGIERDHGSIEVGKVADLFIVTGNPMENIRNTRSVSQVMRRGKIYKTDELLRSVAGKLGPANSDEASKW